MTTPSEFDFVVRKWNSWVPGIKSHADWQHLLHLKDLGQSEKAPLPAAIPKLLQRRLSPLARAVFNAADACMDNSKSPPIVFSSAHGEVNKSLEMLKSIQGGEGVSPTAFSLSVHNAISGLFSIAYTNHQEITVIASAQDGIAPAFIEALGLLQEGNIEVLIVLYDEQLSDFYPSLPPALLAPASVALALKIALQGKGLPLQLCRSSEPRHDDGEHALQIFTFLNFLMSDQHSLHLGNHRHSWIWHKK